jgi:hypothetical protein
MATETDFATGQTMPKAPAGDLCAEIAAAVEKEPGDRVRVTWISGSNYRCNWWAPGNTSAYDNPGMFGLVVTTHQVRQSRFLSVTKTGDRLVIRDVSRTGDVGNGGRGR